MIRHVEHALTFIFDASMLGHQRMHVSVGTKEAVQAGFKIPRHYFLGKERLTEQQTLYYCKILWQQTMC